MEVDSTSAGFFSACKENLDSLVDTFQRKRQKLSDEEKQILLERCQLLQSHLETVQV